MTNKKYFYLFLFFNLIASLIIIPVFISLQASPPLPDKSTNPHRGIGPILPPHIPDTYFTTNKQHATIKIDSTKIDATNKIASAMQIIPNSKLSFQSYRDDQWEIYSGDDNNSNQIRLTNQPTDDIHPELNRGVTSIVYTALQGDDFDIYVMTNDGNQKTALTDNDTDDINPTWSPDGSKILFEAYRDGQAEVYVMNADGSNQIRLTYDVAFDGMPAWSPDGSKIAFSSKRLGGYRIYVMNSDSTNQIKLSDQRYSLHPTWSPDGSLIAYDADDDRDTWQDVWVMDADGNNQHEVYNPSGDKNAWVSSWSPDGTYIAYTLISFIYFQNTWYWQDAYLDAVTIQNPKTVRLSNNGLDWHPSWQLIDTTPPEASLNPLPPYLPIADALISWQGSDDVTGIAYYEIAYQIDLDINWQSWLTTTETSQFFDQGQAGHQYTFRVRAVDKRGNVGNWYTDDSVSTTLYTFEVSGQVSNNRGLPVNYIPQGHPAWLTSQQDKSNASYQAKSISTNSQAITINALGYGTWPTTTLTLQQDSVFDVVLPPIDNLFDFDNVGTATFEPGTWLMAGSPAPQLMDGAGHSGLDAIAFGNAPLPPTNAPSTINWTHTWLDLTPWHNQPLTLTFALKDIPSGTYRSRLERAIILPSTMLNPTLSFLHHTNLEETAGNEAFVLEIETENNITTPITITTHNSQQIWAYLDEISIGSSHPDTWIKASPPTAALPGKDIVYNIYYGNASTIMAENGQISHHLPPQLTFKSANPPPVTPSATLTTIPPLTWNTGNLSTESGPFNIVITATLAQTSTLFNTLVATSTLTTTTPEIEMENNQTEQLIFVGKAVYLPIIYK